MGLNIKDDETCMLARDLAQLTDETMTGADHRCASRAP